MIQFLDMFSGIGGFLTRSVHTSSLRQKVARLASVGETGAGKENAG